MNERFEAKLLYLKRLLKVYILLVPYDSVDVVVESEQDRCYVRVSFYKHVSISNAVGEPSRFVNKREIKFAVSEIGRLVAFYKANLKKRFANRHAVKKPYDFSD